MRVLFINAREDAQKNPGGDTIQAAKTKIALENLGVIVEERGLHELDSLPAYDVAHVFNIQMPESAWTVFQVLQKQSKPIVLSPIYWDMFAYWFEQAASKGGRWGWLARVMGKNRACQMYINWQLWKAPFNTQWQSQRRLLNQAARILPNSQSEADLLQKTFSLNGQFQQKVDLVPNGIDPVLYQTLPTPSDSFLRQYGVRDFVLEVGMIYPVKNQLGVIEALYDLPVPIVFVGQVLGAMPEYAELCKRRARERGNVIFIDRLPYGELPGIYALAAVHVLPSWRETPGLVSLEAAAAGCRVITTSIGSTYDYFGDSAWYCYPNDFTSIRQAVESALQAPTSATLRQRVLNEFTWQRAGEATLASYYKVLNKS